MQTQIIKIFFPTDKMSVQAISNISYENSQILLSKNSKKYNLTITKI
jgi:hypothetical protein